MATTRSSLPLKIVLKIGCSNFRFHPVRFVATVLLLVLSFVFLTVSFCVVFHNNYKDVAQAVLASDKLYAKGYKIQKHLPDYMEVSSFFGTLFNVDFRQEKQLRITYDDLDTFNLKENTYMVRIPAAIPSLREAVPVASGEEIAEFFRKDKSGKCFSNPNGFVWMTQEAFDYYGYELVGQLPTNATEVAISSCFANYIIQFGIREGGRLEGEGLKLNSREEILGKKLCVYIEEDDRASIGRKYSESDYRTIVGVVDTHCDKACFEQHGETRKQTAPYDTHEKIFVSRDFTTEYHYVCAKFTTDKKELAKLIEFSYFETSEGVLYKFDNEIVNAYDASRTIVQDVIKPAGLYLGAIFLVVAIILLVNLVTVSIGRQTKQVGILMSMGASLRQLKKIYLSGIMVLCLIVFVLTLLFSFVGMEVANVYLSNYFNLPFGVLNLDIFAILCVAVLLFGATSLCALTVLKKLNKISPTVVINRGQVR